MIKFLDLQRITQKYSDEIHEAVTRVVDSGYYLQGAENKRFETDYAAYIGSRYCVGCGNGLDALTWIYRAYSIHSCPDREWIGSCPGRTSL